jgi:pilus assembly protein CpaB
MRVVTIVSLAASAILGLGALFVAKAVLPTATAAKAATAIQTDTVPVVVASREIKYGQKLDAGFLSVANVPANLAPQGAYSTVKDVLAADNGGAPVALIPMISREPVLPAKLSGPGSRPSIAAAVAEGMRAYTIKVTEVTGLGGLALPGDRVDVVLMRDLTPSGPERTYISYVVLQNVRLLGMDLNADPTSEKPAVANTATLEVKIEDTQKLSVAGTLGSLSLALRRSGEDDVAPARPLLTSDFLGGGRGRGTAAGPGRSSSPIIIIEGAKRGEARRRPTPAPTAAAAAPAANPAA